MFRLIAAPNSVASIKYFVYVTDAEMARYFKKPANRLAKLFEIPEPLFATVSKKFLALQYAELKIQVLEERLRLKRN